jgi:hypothetical protein
MFAAWAVVWRYGVLRHVEVGGERELRAYTATRETPLEAKDNVDTLGGRKDVRDMHAASKYVNMMLEIRRPAKRLMGNMRRCSSWGDSLNHTFT